VHRRQDGKPFAASIFAGRGYPGSYPFGTDWNMIYISACTGDAGFGNAVHRFTTQDGRKLTAHFKGYPNVTRFLAQAKALFPAPSKLLAAGTSGGALASTCSLSQIAATYSDPALPMYHLALSAAPLQTRYMPEEIRDTSVWNAFHFDTRGRAVGDTCPIDVPAGETYSCSAGYVMRYNQLHLPRIRKGLYQSQRDGVFAFFACSFGATPDANGSCAWAVQDSLLDFIHTDPLLRFMPGFKLFLPAIDCHDIGGGDPPDPLCDWATTTADGVRLMDWTLALLQLPSPVTWENEWDPLTRIPPP
jgi:hypothetical protein